MTDTWELKVIEVSKRNAIQPELTKAGEEGWELVTSTASFNTWMTKVVHLLYLKRPRTRHPQV
jgi:hypothetical protein